MVQAVSGAVLLSALLIGSGISTARAAPDAPVGTEAETASASPLQPGQATAALEAQQPDGMGHLPGHPAVTEPAAEDDDEDTGHGMPAACERMMRAHGHDPHHDPHHGMHGGMHGGEDDEDQDETLAAISAPPPPNWLRGIELDEAQQDRIFEILHESAAAQRRNLRLVENNRRQLKHMGMATDYQESVARRLSDEYAHAIGELTLLRIRTEKRILDVLKPEQRRDAAHQAARDD